MRGDDDDEQDGDLVDRHRRGGGRDLRASIGAISWYSCPASARSARPRPCSAARHLPATEVLPLYARLGSAEQDRVFLPHPHRRIVLATNVAETSLTVPGIRYVIDTGLARINRYSPHSKVQRLVHERISRASADQRKGRCGRQSARGVHPALFRGRL